MSDAIIRDLQDAVLSSGRFRVVAGNSKDALSGGTCYPLGGLSGVVEYDPLEFTITALAGTPVQEVHELLASNRQYLPFDPPMRRKGATLGGTVATGLSGPGRYRFGGVRDFILGVEFISGTGERLRGGGKVVKNAAGFDFPKLMTGSLGEFGVLSEITFKVFPRPKSSHTLIVKQPDLESALALIQRLTASRHEPGAIELQPPGSIGLRISGSAAASRERLRQLLAFLACPVDLLDPEESARHWQAEREFIWVPGGHNLVKVAISPLQLTAFDAALDALIVDAPRRYGVAGHVAYLAWPRSVSALKLEELLQRFGLAGLPLTGDWPSSRLGVQPGAAFSDRIRSVLDPMGRFRRANMSEKGPS